ncbi:MAG: hypothetical protein H6623_04490 [Bdellovibrionaceae bacterium]|nr:hypothetical protein [Pseudobdellovibrionaceae bacterium]
MSSTEKIQNHYRLHEVLSVRVIERVDQESWIVSLSGTLIQVKNKTKRPMRIGEQVRMRIKSLDPVELEFVDRNANR